MSRAFNHVAISVTDIKLAMSWYRDVMGMTVLVEPVEISAGENASDPHLAEIVRAVFGPRLGKFLICHMCSANGTGIELFQFIEPEAARRQDNFEYWKTGCFHIAVTDQDVEGWRQGSLYLEASVELTFSRSPMEEAFVSAKTPLGMS